MISNAGRRQPTSNGGGGAGLEFGLDTFGDIPEDDAGNLLTHGAAIRQVVEEAVLADELGVDVFAVGEHHRPEFAVSAPETVLAGIATRTEHIKLASGVTVLSSDDPVRVFQRFATVDALSAGRAQVILGRGSFTESFPLFGYNLADYDLLFEEKIGLFAQLLQEKPVTWEGTTRASLEDADVYPKTESGHLDTWVGVGGSPESVVRALRGWPPVRRREYEADVAHGSLYIGSPETVANKIARSIRALGVGRFDLIYSNGSIPASARLHAVGLYGTEVIPRVRELLADDASAGKAVSA